MKLGRGVEWAVHCYLNLAWVGSAEAVTVARLAAFYELPVAYLNKQVQALVRAGIASSVPGPRGGFRLARPPDRISLLDVVTAIEGSEPAFRCFEHVVRLGTYIVDHDEAKLQALLRVVSGIWVEHPPAQTLLGVARLALPDMQFEVDAVAVRP